MVVVRCTNEDDWTITRDVECTSRSNLAEEYVGYCTPEKDEGFIEQILRSEKRGNTVFVIHEIVRGFVKQLNTV